MSQDSIRTGRFIVGTTLLTGSFLVYLAYPIILLFLPFSGRIKVVATVAVWLLSWGIFSAGIYLSGPRGIEWIKGLWKRISGGGTREKHRIKEFSD